MTNKAAKEAAFRFRACIAKERAHVRVGDKRGDQTFVSLLGTVAEMHGVDGVCWCCFGRGESGGEKGADEQGFALQGWDNRGSTKDDSRPATGSAVSAAGDESGASPTDRSRLDA